MIPISKVDVRDAEPFVLEVLRSGSLTQGPVVARLEQGFADLVGVPHAVAVNSGTTALVAALQVLDLQPGDEVVTSPFTFAATLNAILAAGATARFADIGEDDLAVDPSAVEAVVGPRTAVLLPVHLYGQMADMSPLMDLAADHGLHLVEDAAQSLGATYRGQAAGSFGTGCFSFYGTKNITTGEGGMVTTADDVLADRLRVLRNQGMRRRYAYEMPGHNYRMTDLHAAIGLPQLTKVADISRRRQRHAARLGELLADVVDLRLPRELPGRRHVWHQYTVLLPAGCDRDQVVALLAAAGVGSGIYYPTTVFDHDCYREHPRVVTANVPVADSVARRCLSLPVHQHLDDGDVDAVATALRQVLGA